MFGGQSNPVSSDFHATSTLIPGISGFIGSTLAETILAQGGRLRGLDNLSTGKRENLAEVIHKIDFQEGDLANLDVVRSACRGVDYVLHEGAIPSVPKSVLDPISSNNLANVDGTLNLLVAARDAKVKRVVHAASSAAYGDTPTLPKHEKMLPSPISPYAVAKLAGEYYMSSFFQWLWPPQTVSLRYFNVFGPRQDPTSPYSGVLASSSLKCSTGNNPRFSAMAARAATLLTWTMWFRQTCWPAPRQRRMSPGASSTWPPAAVSI